jgi:Pyridoxamine 5'-phosphate oxidase
MSLSEPDLEYLKVNHSAAMITVGGDGVAKAVRVGVALVDGRLWSSGTADRVRTKRLRQDSRCTLFVFDAGFGSMTLETAVTVLDGPDAPELNLRLFRGMQGRPTGPLSWFGAELEDQDFLRTMVDEQRLIYEFDVQRTYGLH